MSQTTLKFFCVSTYFKGQDFLKSCKKEGHNVYLLTKKKLENEAWPWESIDEALYIDEWDDQNVMNGLAY